MPLVKNQDAKQWLFFFVPHVVKGALYHRPALQVFERKGSFYVDAVVLDAQ
jgi:hypothetical protein